MSNPYDFLYQGEPSPQGVGDPLLRHIKITDMGYLMLEIRVLWTFYHRPSVRQYHGFS